MFPTADIFWIIGICLRQIPGNRTPYTWNSFEPTLKIISFERPCEKRELLHKFVSVAVAKYKYLINTDNRPSKFLRKRFVSNFFVARGSQQLLVKPTMVG